VIFKEKQVGGQARLTTDEEPCCDSVLLNEFQYFIQIQLSNQIQPANERVHNAKRCVITDFIYLSLSFIYPYD